MKRISTPSLLSANPVSTASAPSVTEREFFAFDSALALNVLFLALSAVFLLWRRRVSSLPGGERKGGDKILL
ncbi:hypothetical protein [Congregibacter litoralis]|uniref:hypothetical protein n=1 Tax=Congregibacter litoralis TaxID=393662 RepID=UPI00006AD8DC|nr:hypothetical protein [Congregibacter litoralis]